MSAEHDDRETMVDVAFVLGPSDVRDFCEMLRLMENRCLVQSPHHRTIIFEIESQMRLNGTWVGPPIK